MLDPELSYAFVSMRKGKAICGMTVRKASRIEVEAETFFLGPCDPIMKMAGFNFIAIHFHTAIFAVASMQVEPVFTRNQQQCFINISPKLSWVACLAGIMTCDGQPASEGLSGRLFQMLKTTNVVPLPTVKGNGNTRQRRQCLVSIYAD